MGKGGRVVQAKAKEERKPLVFAWRQYLPIAAVLILTAIVYAQVRGFDFMPIDDSAYVSLNDHVRDGLTVQSVIWALTSREAANWHPLTWMSHMLDCQFFGLDAGRHHITNLLFHLADALLLFILLKRMTGSVWRSVFVAGLFGLHPLHVESVAWIAERKDVLSTFFWMLTVLAYVCYAEKPKTGRYVLVAIAFALGLMAKPMLVSIPIILILLDYWPLKRTDLGWKRLVLEKIPLCVLSLGSCVMTFIAQHNGGAVQDLTLYPVTVRLANSLVAYASYLGKTVAPTNIGPLYPHPGNTLPVWMVLLSAAVLVALTAASVALRKKAPYLIVGWLIYVVSLAPVIGLVQVGSEGRADRYTYIPLIGIFVSLAWLAPEALGAVMRRGSGVALGIAGALIILALSAMTQQQVGVWKDSDTLVRQMLRATHNHPLARVREAKFLSQEGKAVEAEQKLAELIKAFPSLPEARNAHACALAVLNRHPEAIAEFKEAIRLRPGYAETISNLGVEYEGIGNPREGLKWCRKALELAPSVGQWHANLAHVLATLGKPKEAVEEYKRALAIHADIPNAESELGMVLFNNNDTAGGIEHVRRAVEANPDDANSHYRLGVMLQRAGNNNQAIEQLMTAIELQPTMADAHGELAVALDAEGRKQEAQEELVLAKKYSAGGASQAKP